MTNFIEDNTPLPPQKTNVAPLAPTANPSQWVTAPDWNALDQALLDVQTFCRGAPWFGLVQDASDPAPAGVPHYLWLKSDGTLNVDALTRFIGAAQLVNTAVTAGSYANANITVDAQGRVTAAANGSSGGGGTVTQVNTGTGLTGGPITTSGTVSMANTAVTPGSYTSTNLTVDAQGRITAASNGSGGGAPVAPEYGAAAGNSTMDGVATIFGLVPSGNVYTASTDIACHNLTINNGVTLKMQNFALFCSGTLTNNGTISNNGHDAPDFNGGTATAGGRFGTTLAGGGGAGTASSQAPNGYFVTAAGAAGGTGAGGIGATGPTGGGGGGGATSGGNAGSAGGAITVNNTNLFMSMVAMLTGLTDTGTNTRWTFGSGGGEGSTALGGAGGGGAGGGMLYVAAKVIAGTGAMRARGGAGSAGTNAGAPGGGGGGGGFACVIYGTGGGNQTVDANGGAGGAGLSGGGAGGAGGAGIVALFNLNGDGTNP